MDLKYYSWIFAIVAFLTHILGPLKLLLLIIILILFTLGFLITLCTQSSNIDEYLENSNIENPLETQRMLGLNLVGEQKAIVLITPNIKIQTESSGRRHKNPLHHEKNQINQQSSSNASLNSLLHHQQQQQQHSVGIDPKKKSILDSGIELLFKKHGKHAKEGYVYLESKEPSPSKSSYSSSSIVSPSSASSSTATMQSSPVVTGEEKKWKPFENIKIYTDRKRNASNHNSTNDKPEIEQVQYGEDIIGSTNTGTGGNQFRYQVTHSMDAHLLDEHGSPKKKQKTMLSGNKQIDQLLHTIIDYILRDFIDSWFCSLSDNKEFSDFRVRNCIEECVTNICTRVQNTLWVPLMTTKMVDDLANHTKIFRLATQSVNARNQEKKKVADKLSPQRKSKKSQHRRNKSDTDLDWYPGSGITQKNVANSKFYTETIDEKVLSDPEANLIDAFFSQSDLFKKECTDERELERYLTHVMETVLYFTLPEEDFACIPLRTFLSTLLANVVLKPFLHMVSDPDFINLQVAKMFFKEPPPVDYFIRALRQSTDLSELRACRQLITKEMNVKYKESKTSPELQSLHFAQKLIDLRISYLQNSKDYGGGIERERLGAKLPILTLDELLFKELARSYFLDYLSVLNLQKYVIFYLTADEWKCILSQSLIDIQANKMKSSKEEIYRKIREKAQNIHDEYLVQSSQNYLAVDSGLIKALSIRLKDTSIIPESNWFDSICKFVYEKLKNEDIFLNKFYQSSAYKKLLLELEVIGQTQEPEIDSLHNYSETSGSDTNSGDINFYDDNTGENSTGKNVEKTSEILSMSGANKNFPTIKTNTATAMEAAEYEINRSDVHNLSLLKPDLLDITGAYKHSRSHSDCTGLVVPGFSDLNLLSIVGVGGKTDDKSDESGGEEKTVDEVDSGVENNCISNQVEQGNLDIKLQFSQERAHSTPTRVPEIKVDGRPKLQAKIINTAILCEGQYAVYAIEVSVIEDNHEKSWHIYRRYSKFLELKKLLIKKYPAIAKIPFPAKRAFQNTQRSVLEHRMGLLNNFLKTICNWSENNEDMMRIIRDFLEPDTDDRKIHGGAVIRTIEHIVNPLKSGMRTIKNMPDTLVGGFSKFLLGKGPLKEELNVMEQSSEYPALTSAIHLLDEVFDLQARSQWLRRGIINRLLGTSWFSQAINKKITHAAKSLIETDKIELLLKIILNNIWPDGKQRKHSSHREDNVKLRTRLAAQMALFALLFDDLKRVVGSETSRTGLLNFFNMFQHKTLNLRLSLILLNDILTILYRVDSMTRHVNDD